MRHLAAAITFAAALPLASGAWAAEPERGRALYESQCTTCHAESVHGRKKRVATDFHEVRRWVDRWNGNLGLKWSGEDLDDVAAYLNMTYYRYPCPPSICKVVSRK